MRGSCRMHAIIDIFAASWTHRNRIAFTIFPSTWNPTYFYLTLQYAIKYLIKRWIKSYCLFLNSDSEINLYQNIYILWDFAFHFILWKADAVQSKIMDFIVLHIRLHIFSTPCFIDEECSSRFFINKKNKIK